mmetsp:Transcript_9869/g.22447  ORF Transcript_9869/g.22447 Transcript_9869/m.22447 type:complete len:186 (+) Transcript_9869:104-661(+)
MGQTCCCDVEQEGVTLVGVSQAPAIDPNNEKLDEPTEDIPEDSFNPSAKQSKSPGLEPLPPPEATPPPPPPAAEAAPPSKLAPAGIDEHVQTFIVDVKTEGSGGKLGFAVGRRQGDDLLEVIKVAEAGVIPEWNRANPEKSVAAGCLLLAINGAAVNGRDKDDVVRDIQAGMQASRLQIEFKRPI